MHFFPQNKLTTFCLVVALKTQAANTIFHCQNKTNKVVRYGNIFFCSHNRQGGATAVDLPARSHPGVAPPLDISFI